VTTPPVMNQPNQPNQPLAPTTGASEILAAAAAGDIERLRELVAPPPLLTVAEAARLLAVSERQVWRLVGLGLLDRIRLGRASRISRSSLNRFIASGGSG
jgi:excisionase family DNA binding protein